jgi:hypothetical protein
MANVKGFFKKQFSFLVILVVFGGFSSIASLAKAESFPQMINLNMQFKGKNKTLKSDLSMPFYQTAEISKMINNKNVVIELNPRIGKNKNEVSIEMKFYKTSGSKAYATKEIIAKIGKASLVSVKGMTVSVTPIL